MAFTDEEKTRILHYLGYSVFESDSIAVRAVNGLDAYESKIGFIVRDILNKIAYVESEVYGTIPLSKAITDGAIQLRAHYALSHLWRLARAYVVQLSTMLKVPVCSDIFNSAVIFNTESQQ